MDINLSNQTIERLFKKAGAKKVSKHAKKLLKKIIDERIQQELDKYGLKIAEMSVKIATNDGRIIIQPTDVKLSHSFLEESKN